MLIAQQLSIYTDLLSKAFSTVSTFYGRGSGPDIDSYGSSLFTALYLNGTITDNVETRYGSKLSQISLIFVHAYTIYVCSENSFMTHQSRNSTKRFVNF